MFDSPALPTETWFSIFALACTDGGKTGCSLSAVSRHMRTISAEYRYYSVAVLSDERGVRLLEMLTPLPPILRRVRHLHLDRGALTLSPSSTTTTTEHALPPEQTRRVQSSESDKLNANSSSTIRALLALTSPTLHTLSIVSFLPDDTSLLLHNPTVRLPHLTELAVRGIPHIPLTSSFAPRLERLHVCATLLSLSDCRALADAFPHLTHLRLSRAKLTDYAQIKVLQALCVTMRVVPLSRSHDDGIFCMPEEPAERRLYVEPEFFSDLYGYPPLSSVKPGEGRSCLVRLPTRFGKRDLIAEGTAALRDWQDRMEEKPGPWEVPI